MAAVFRQVVLLSLCVAIGPIASVSQTVDPKIEYQNLVERVLDSADGDIEIYFDKLVASKSELTGLDDYDATIAVREEIAARLIESDQSVSAISHLQSAASLALAAADAPTLLRLYLAQLKIHQAKRNTERGIPVAVETIKLAQASGDQSALVQATLIEIYLRRTLAPNYPVEESYDSLLALESTDELAIKLHRARFGKSPRKNALSPEQRWLEVRDIAIAQERLDIEAEAWEALAWIAYHRDEFELAAIRFRSGESTGQSMSRSAQNWGRYLRLFDQLGESAYALEIVDRELSANVSNQESGFRAELQDARSRLLSTQGEHRAAYEALRDATDLRDQDDFIPQFFAPAKMSAASKAEVVDAVGVDAAILAAQREADLAVAQSHRQFLIATVVATLLLMALLAMAYRFKLRAAAAETLAREAADLRAENAQLLALRYQLNPHFLFNALEGLRSRFGENATAGLTLLDRLTEFCRLVFTLRKDGLQTVEDEITMIESFLRIEQDRWEDNLVVNLDFDPSTKAIILPTMLVQPLVENALKYGAETSTDRITIGVTTRVENTDTLIISITNSGHWLEETALRERSSNRIGLSNIRRRLASYYPDRHNFKIGPSEAGVTATLTLHGKPHQPS